MEITLNTLKKAECYDKDDAIFNYIASLKISNVREVVETAITSKERRKLSWSSFLLCNLFTKKNRSRYAVFAADLVLSIVEEAFPSDTRVRNVIQAGVDFSMGKILQKEAHDAKVSIWSFCPAKVAVNQAAVSASYAAIAFDNNVYFAANAADYAASAAYYDAYVAEFRGNENAISIINADKFTHYLYYAEVKANKYIRWHTDIATAHATAHVVATAKKEETYHKLIKYGLTLIDEQTEVKSSAQAE